MSSSQKAPKPRKLGANKVERQRIDHKGQEISGWLFVLPMIIILGVFMFIPIIMALWVSVELERSRHAVWFVRRFCGAKELQ